MTKKYALTQNKLGYYEVDPKPSVEELQKHYAEKYYQDSHGSYETSYTDEELEYFSAEAALALKTVERNASVPNKTLLDLGCGEGFFAAHFKKKGWDVKCVDFSSDGILRHNPSLIDDFTQSDLLSYLDSHGSALGEYDLVNLDNVLEHVIDPVKLLQSLKSGLKPGAIVRIDVPNDFSSFQSLLLERGCTAETWVAPPEHLSYFNKTSLVSLLEDQGCQILSLQADFPIEQFLLSDHSNYWKDRSLGKGAHNTRVTVTNYLAKTNMERYIDYREAAADLEFGRLLTAYVTV